MKKLWKIVTFCTFILLALLGGANVAQASSGSTSLPPGFLVGDDTGFQAGTDGEYFIVNNDIKPGQTFSRVITMSNYSTESGTENTDGRFAINLVMNPEDADHVPETSGAINLLEAISVTLTYQGEVIYEGPINGEGTPIANQMTNALDLGALEIGEVRNIQADFTVSDAYPEEDWKNVNSVDFYWVFFSNRERVDPPPPVSSEEPPDSSDSTAPSSSLPDTKTSSSSPSGKLPQTGEDWRNVLLGMIAGLALVTVALIIAKNRRRES